MPKINYIKDEWAIPKNCAYCGKTFYPIKNERFCGSLCETHHADMIDFYDWQLVEDMLNEWEDSLEC